MRNSMQVPLSRQASAIVLNAHLLLVVLIYASPVIGLFDGPAMQGLLAGYTALGIFILAHEMQPGEADYFLFFARRAVPLIALPLLWIFVQALPIAALAHPI